MTKATKDGENILRANSASVSFYEVGFRILKPLTSDWKTVVREMNFRSILVYKIG